MTVSPFVFPLDPHVIRSHTVRKVASSTFNSLFLSYPLFGFIFLHITIYIFFTSLVFLSFYSIFLFPPLHYIFRVLVLCFRVHLNSRWIFLTYFCLPSSVVSFLHYCPPSTSFCICVNLVQTNRLLADSICYESIFSFLFSIYTPFLPSSFLLNILLPSHPCSRHVLSP